LTRTRIPFANTLTDLLSDRSALEERGANGRRWVAEWLETNRVAGCYETTYREAIATRRRSKVPSPAMALTQDAPS
jgi:hypothetical protein